MKKFLACFLAAMLLSTALTGCGPKESGNQTPPPAKASEVPEQNGSAEKKPLTMWFWGCTPEYQEVMKKSLVDVYNASQNEYELTIEFRNSVDDDVAVSLSAGQGPDIVYGSGPAFITPYAEAGKLLSLDKYAEQYGWADRLQAPIYNACKVKGSLYALPNSMFVTGLFYNKAVLDQYGWELPTNIDELVTIMDSALKENMSPILYGVKGWRPNLEQIPAVFMTNWAGPNAEYQCLTNQQKWNNPAMVSALNVVNEWYQKGYLSNDMLDLSSSEAMQMFIDGKAPFKLGDSAGYQTLASFCENDEQAANFGFIPFPSGNPGIPDPVYTVAVTATFSINAACKYPDAAAAVVDIMMSQSFMESMTAQWPGYWCVPLSDYSTVDTSKMNLMGKQCVDIMKTVADAVAEGKFGYYPSTFFPAATASAMQNIDTVWFGTATVEDLLNQMDTEFAKEYAKGLVPELAKPVQ